MPRTKRGIRRCIVVGCGSTNMDDFQLFPRKRKLRKAWIKLANVRDPVTNTLLKPCNLDFVCRKHFIDGVPVPTQDLGYPGSDYRLYNPTATVHEILEAVCKELQMKIQIPVVSVTSMAATPKAGQLDVQLIRTTTSGLSGATETTTGKIGIKLVKTATSNDSAGSTMPTAKRIDIKLLKPPISIAPGRQTGVQRIKTPISIAPVPTASQIGVPLIKSPTCVSSGPTMVPAGQAGTIKLFKPIMAPAGHIDVKVIKPSTSAAPRPVVTPVGQAGIIKLFKPNMVPAGQIDIKVVKTPTSVASGHAMTSAGQTGTIKVNKTPSSVASAPTVTAGRTGTQQVIGLGPGGDQNQCDSSSSLSSKRNLSKLEHSESVLSELERDNKRKRFRAVETSGVEKNRVGRSKQEAELLDSAIVTAKDPDDDQDVFAPLMMS